MALSKKRKNELVEEYKERLSRSRAVFMTEYTGVNMPQLDTLRARLREVGGEFHVVKNTLGKIVFEEAGYEFPDELFSGSTAAGFAFEDSPATAKALADFAGEVEFLKIKGGFLGSKLISGEEIRALAELPPLPVMRARLMGLLQAPAAKLARTLAEPGRGLAAVVRAYSERENAPV
ncbi:MAG TPA: 50S ribosomal protein L10 [Anaerolineales bacterium]|nr:50S ribosomal protein L10 [Anaerolineales bacterium]